MDCLVKVELTSCGNQKKPDEHILLSVAIIEQEFGLDGLSGLFQLLLRDFVIPFQ